MNQFKEEKTKFNIGDIVLWYMFKYKELAYPCIIKGFRCDINRGETRFIYEVRKLGEKDTRLYDADAEELKFLSEPEAAIWKLKL